MRATAEKTPRGAAGPNSNAALVAASLSGTGCRLGSDARLPRRASTSGNHDASLGQGREPRSVSRLSASLRVRAGDGDGRFLDACCCRGARGRKLGLASSARVPFEIFLALGLY
jgi:hypothetical protein